MAQQAGVFEALSPRRTVGFACNQAFMFYVLYMGFNRSFEVGGLSFERAELFFMLAALVVGFSLFRRAGAGFRRAALAKPALYVCAFVASAASLASSLLPEHSVAWVVPEGLLVGMPISFLLIAWGLTFGRERTAVTVSEVFLASLIGGAVCLLFSLVGSSSMLSAAFALLPLASVFNIDVPAWEGGAFAIPSDLAEGADEKGRLSAKIMAGTFLFGSAAGLMETYGTDPGSATMPFHAASFVVFCAFLIGSLSLLLSHGFGRGAALNKSYRLAILVVMVGILVVGWPVADLSPTPGKAYVLAGYLGLEAVLISLFLVLAEILEVDSSLSFSQGFAALFAGELAGLLLGNVNDLVLASLVRDMPVAAGAIDSASYLSVVLAGGLVLVAYVFLFTERDFDSLSEIVTKEDAFERTCEAISSRFELSHRESEILAFALHGRTSERIAQELTVSKSTVDTHLRRIYAKTGVHSRQELLDVAESMGKAL